MGRLLYGTWAEPITMADDLLAYLRIVVGAKLRNQEGFMLSWHHEGDDPGDRSSAWLHPAVAIRFVFDQSARTEIDPALLARLHAGASSASGLVLPLSVADAVTAAPPELDRLQRGSRTTPDDPRVALPGGAGRS